MILVRWNLNIGWVSNEGKAPIPLGAIFGWTMWKALRKRSQKLRRNDPIPFISDVINAPPENSCHSVLLSLWRHCTRQDLSFPWAHKRPPKTQRELGGFLADRLLKEKDVRKWSIKNQNIHIWATEAKNSRPDPSSLAVGYHLIRWGTPITIKCSQAARKKEKQAVNYPIGIHVFSSFMPLVSLVACSGPIQTTNLYGICCCRDTSSFDTHRTGDVQQKSRFAKGIPSTQLGHHLLVSWIELLKWKGGRKKWPFTRGK